MSCVVLVYPLRENCHDDLTCTDRNVRRVKEAIGGDAQIYGNAKNDMF